MEPWLVQMASRYMSLKEVFWWPVGVQPEEPIEEELLSDEGLGRV